MKRVAIHSVGQEIFNIIYEPTGLYSIMIHQELMRLWCRYQLLVEPFEIDVPKSHLIFHIIWRAEWQGNPWRYHCFYDESLNKALKRCLRLCHQAHFESRAFVRIEHVLATI